jgi:outer membrane protein TolC
VGVRVLDAFAASRDAARALFAAGNVAELDLITQEAAYQEARATIAQLELEVLDRREQMNRLLGLHGEQTAWNAQGGLPPAPPQIELPGNVERRAIEASLELAEMRSQLEGAARRTGLARAEGWLPDISLGVNAEQDGSGWPAGPGWPGWPGWRVGGSARFTLPLFDRKQGDVASREAAFDAQMERYHGAAVDIRAWAREARNRVLWTHARARHLQEIVVPVRRRVLEQALLQYNAMQIDVFQLLQARREELAAELAYHEALRELWTARAAIDALLAGRRVGLPAAAAPPTISASPTDSTGGH